MITAAIDIGSNTLLLLVAERNGAKITPLLEHQLVPRLGRGVDKTGELHPESVLKAVTGLQMYRDRIRHEFGDIPVVVTATSAVRDARNGREFLSEVYQKTGFDIRILSGDEEAEVTFKGALGMSDVQETNNYGVVDIGGGSTEIALGTPLELASYHSYDMGCVRFTERYLGDHPVSKDRITVCRQAIRDTFRSFAFPFHKVDQWFAVAGTATSLAFLVNEMSEYESAQIQNTVITVSHISEWILRLASMSNDEMVAKWPIVMEGRADIFLAGLLILDELCQAAKTSKLTVSVGGIRHGMLVTQS